MTQKIKSQDGIVSFEANDSTYAVKVGIKGQLDVTAQVNVGDDPSADGLITTLPNTDLNIEPSDNLNLTPGGDIVLNGMAWPDGSIAPHRGTFIGSSGLNTLQIYPFVYASAGSDTYDATELNTLYPNIEPGQSVVGPNVIYECISLGQWRTLGSSSSSGTPYYIPVGDTYVVPLNNQVLYEMDITVDGDIVVNGFLIEV